VHSVDEKLQMAGVRRVCASVGAAATDLNAIVGQQAVIEAKRSGVGDDLRGAKAGDFEFGCRQRPRDDRIGKNWHSSAVQGRGQSE
jgi:hypothetical protein